MKNRFYPSLSAQMAKPLLAVVMRSHQIKLVESSYRTGNLYPKGHSQKVNVVAISPDGKTLVSGSDDNTIKIWNLATAKQIRTLKGHSDSIHALAISPEWKNFG